MKRFKVTSEPTWSGGSTARNYFAPGDVVSLTVQTPDFDGDVMAEGPNTDGQPRYIALACLTPIDEAETETAPVVLISAVRAALVALGIEADVVAVAQAIEKEVSR